MKKISYVISSVVAALGLIIGGAFVEATADMSGGAAKFKEQCAVCHVDGGNIINTKKTLQKKDREANNIKTAADIVRNMRNPGPGMTKFDEKTISDKDAASIAEYILKTY